jgi:histidinol-phosphate phosphatase family protein
MPFFVTTSYQQTTILMTAIFFDRDGVVNRRRVDDYVKSWEEFEFLPEIFDLLPSVHAAGYLAVLVTNQRGIARRLMSEETLGEIHERMQSMLRERTGHAFDAIYHCPHDTGDGCDCRKPLPGMLLRAAHDLDLDLPASWMIGDSESDIEAGIAAGCHTAKLDPEGGETRGEVSGRTLTEVWNEVSMRLAGTHR